MTPKFVILRDTNGVAFAIDPADVALVRQRDDGTAHLFFRGKNVSVGDGFHLTDAPLDCDVQTAVNLLNGTPQTANPDEVSFLRAALDDIQKGCNVDAVMRRDWVTLTELMRERASLALEGKTPTWVT